MAKLKINWLEKKANDWILANLLQEDGTEIKDVSINRTSKKGEVFPNFDGLAPSLDIEGELWQSPAGKNYLFPPKPKLEAPAFIRQAGNSAFKAKQIEEAQVRTSGFVAKAQDNKEWGIKTASTMNKAIDLAIAEGKPEPITILKWREWVWNNWTVEDDQYPPFK